jgi:hypothetical protein
MMGLKQETVVAIFFGTLTVVGTIGMTAFAALRDTSTHSALGDATMAQVIARLDRIESSVSGVPLYVQRLTQLETWRDNQLAFNGAVDGRMNKVETNQAIMLNKLDDITQASKAKLR